MPFVSTRDLKRRFQLDGPEKTVAHLTEAIQQKHLRPEHFSLRGLAEALIPDGDEFVKLCDPRGDGMVTPLLEAGAVDSASFKTISGQLAYSAILEAYENPAFVWPKLARVVPTRYDGEKIPGINPLGDAAEQVDEGQPYPLVGTGEDWIDTPSTVKRGLVVPVTKEAIFFDRTNVLLDRCREVGYWLGVNIEKRVIDVALGVTNNFKWKGTAYDTYQATTPWDNITASNGLTDWTDIEAALTCFASMTDPGTGEPILIAPRQLLLNSSKVSTAKYIMNSTQVVIDPNANAGTANYQQWVPNGQLVGTYEIISSPWVDARYTAGSVTATTWYIGDFPRAFAYMQNWPVTVTQAPANSEDEFNRDIVMKFKASERGVAAVMNPRYTQQCTA